MRKQVMQVNRTIVSILALCLLSACANQSTQPGPASDGRWWEQMDAGGVSLRQANYQAAREHFESAIETARTATDSELRGAISMNRLGMVHQETGRYAEAEAMYRRALAVYEDPKRTDEVEWSRSFGALEKVYRNVGGLYRLQGRRREAELMYRKAVLRWSHQPDSRRLAIAVIQLGACASEVGSANTVLSCAKKVRHCGFTSGIQRGVELRQLRA